VVAYYKPLVKEISDYYPYGWQKFLGKYQFGANAGSLFEDWDSTRGTYYTLYRLLDARIARWYQVEPLWESYVNESGYAVVGNNPILYIDENGEFKLEYSEEDLEQYGLSKSDMERFERIVNNIANIVKDNPQALEAIMNTTGFSKERILEDLQPGKGPIIRISEIDSGGGAQGGIGGIVFDYKVIKMLSSISSSDSMTLATQVLGTALTLLHEYGHYGDQVTNEGYNTGQYTVVEADNGLYYNYYDYKKDPSGSKKLGRQRWKVSLTGHRGTDIEVVGYGVQVIWDVEKQRFEIQKGELAPTLPDYFRNSIKIPTSLPKNMQGTNILRTLKVE